MRIRVDISIDDETTRTNISEEACVFGDEPPHPALAKLLEEARRKAEATLSLDDGCEESDETKGTKVGTAYVEVRPEFIGFDGEEFEQAVRRVVASDHERALRPQGPARAWRP